MAAASEFRPGPAVPESAAAPDHADLPLAPAASGGAEELALTAELPSTYSYRPSVTPAQRQAVAEFVEGKAGPGTELRPRLAVLCIAFWLQEIAGRQACCTADLRALYPLRPEQKLPAAATVSKVLTEGREHRVFEPLGKGWYRVTPFGQLLVESLPDDALVGTVYGQRSAARAHRWESAFIQRRGA